MNATESTADFDGADYFSTDEDCETLEHEHPVSAIEYLVDGYGARESIAAVLDEIGDVTVYAWRRKAVHELEWRAFGFRAAEVMAESFDEEYSDPDEGVLSQAAVHEPTLAKELGEVFRRHVTDDGKHDPVWYCEKVAERVYTRAEVETLLREENQGWFE